MLNRLAAEGGSRIEPSGMGLFRGPRLVAGRVKRSALMAGHTLHRGFRVAFQRLRGRADYARWSDPVNLERWWETRTQKLASLVPPHSRVVEFGAGRERLRAYLPPGCEYFPSDLTRRSAGTILCDLNTRPLPDLRHLSADIAIFGGVLEYLTDVRGVVAWLATQVPQVIVSYDHPKQRARTIRRLVERMRRFYFGYMNDISLETLIASFDREGFRCTATDVWTTQTILVFAQERSSDPHT